MMTYKEIASFLAMTETDRIRAAMTRYKGIASCLAMTETESNSCLAMTTYKEIASCLAMTETEGICASQRRKPRGISLRNDDIQGDCFVPGNDGKSLTLRFFLIAQPARQSLF
ncbi:MAG TPA: hypothetical protein VFF57_12670 [Hanamia sp.]|nr:hypothetical protein [Hanamia sp.]